MKSLRVTDLFGSVGPLETVHCVSSPLGVLICMAEIAGIGGSVFHGKIRTGDSNTVVPAIVNAHISLFRHMALHALSPLGSGLMKMVGGGVKTGGVFLIGHMTTGTELIGVGVQFHGMRIVAVDTFDPLMKHFTLDI